MARDTILVPPGKRTAPGATRSTVQPHPPLAPAVPTTTAPKLRQARLDELVERLDKAREGGGQDRIERQHDKGKLTARERLALLCDHGSFVEVDALRQPGHPAVGRRPTDQPGDGVVAGHASLDGRPVAVYAQDFTVQGGSLGAAHAAKIAKVLDHAVKARCPVIGINDSGGARIQEGVSALAGYGDIFFRNVQASGLVPQVTIIAGPCAGGAVYSPALTDVVIMIEGTGHMFLTGPDVVETVTGERVSFDELGGAGVHGAKSGVAHLVAADEAEALELARQVLSFLPQSCQHPLPVDRTSEEATAHEDPVLDGIIPSDPSEPYAVTEVIHRLVDGGRFLELFADHAPNARVGFARLGGIPVGIVANDPSHLAGVLDIHASVKMARFVRLCDSFNVPVVTLVDVPGFLPGTDQEWGGIIRHGAKLVHAYCEATCPKLTVTLRKAYGGAYIAMASKHLGTDANLAWPTAEIAVMGAEGAVKVLHRRELNDADDPEAEMERLKGPYREAFSTPYQAAGEGFVDEVLAPRETRIRLIQWLERLVDKEVDRPAKRHTNTPL